MRAKGLLMHTAMEDMESPKFTVNQIVLLQKLKQTGLTKLQILKGLEEMEKLEDIGLCSPGLRLVFVFLFSVLCTSSVVKVQHWTNKLLAALLVLCHQHSQQRAT